MRLLLRKLKKLLLQFFYHVFQVSDVGFEATKLDVAQDPAEAHT